MISNLDLLGQLSVLNANPVIATYLFLLAVEKKLLPSLNLYRWFSPFNVSKADSWSLQVDINSTLLARNFCCFSHHFDEYFMLFVLDLCSIDPTNVHALL